MPFTNHFNHEPITSLIGCIFLFVTSPWIATPPKKNRKLKYVSSIFLGTTVSQDLNNIVSQINDNLQNDHFIRVQFHLPRVMVSVYGSGLPALPVLQ